MPLFETEKKAHPEGCAFFCRPDFSIERNLLKQGCRYIAGIDEAGRGALAGPLSVGITIYSADFISNPVQEIITRINDSKKISPRVREELCGTIKSHAAYCSVKLISHRVIDDSDINKATEKAVRFLIENARPVPDAVIMDGNFNFRLPVPYYPVKKGDTISISIASSSILAKVKRDYVMGRIEKHISGYGFDRNKGYGTLEHRKAITGKGYSRFHRRTYEPVKSIIENENRNLFK